MRTHWSDGSSSIEEMSHAGEADGYEYLAITDHAKGLKIAGSIRVLRCIELNLNPPGLERSICISRRSPISTSCWVAFIRYLRDKEDLTDRLCLRPEKILLSTSSTIREGAFTSFARA